MENFAKNVLLRRPKNRQALQIFQHLYKCEREGGRCLLNIFDRRPGRISSQICEDNLEYGATSAGEILSKKLSLHLSRAGSDHRRLDQPGPSEPQLMHNVDSDATR